MANQLTGLKNRVVVGGPRKPPYEEFSFNANLRESNANSREYISDYSRLISDNSRQGHSRLKDFLSNFATKDAEATPSFITSRFYYSYDNAGNRLTMNSQNYGYDNINQLTSVTGAQTHNYQYDAVGNRQIADGTTYSANSLNQYSSVGAQAYTYDGNGNLTNDGTNTYSYDVENRLSMVSGLSSIVYEYDGFGRRISKTVNGNTTYFVYDGDQIIEERDASNTLLASYVYGAGIDEPLTMARNSQTYYYFYDGLGSVTDITNSKGEVIESYVYDIYGTPNITSSIGNTRYFTGRELDPETNLYYYRERYYSSGLGRFLQVDPMGYIDSMNLYGYCFNNPSTFLDPFGLSGYLTIHSLSGNNGVSSFTYGSHSWIEYKSDNGNDSTMYGTWGNTNGGPLGFRQNTPIEFQLVSQGEGVSRTLYINDEQEKRMNNMIDKYRQKGKDAWSWRSACPAFVANVWATATGEHLDYRHFWPFGYADPNLLAKSIEEANKRDPTNQNKYRSNSSGKCSSANSNR